MAKKEFLVKIRCRKNLRLFSILRKITNEQILYIKTLREKEGLSYSSISKESGWSKATICRVLNGAYDI